VGGKVHSRELRICGKILSSPMEYIKPLGSGIGSRFCLQDPGATGLEGSQKGRRKNSLLPSSPPGISYRCSYLLLFSYCVFMLLLIC